MTTHIIYTPANRALFVRLRNYFGISFILMPLLRPSNSKNHNSIISNLFGKETDVIVFYILLAGLLLALIFHFLSRRKTTLGKINMTLDALSIQLPNENFLFKIEELTHFKFKSGITDVSQNIVTMISSYDNWLSFEYKNATFEYQFTIESSYSYKEFQKLVAGWRSNGIELKRY